MVCTLYLSHNFLVPCLGDWENGMREGKGTEQSQYGKYVGHWKNDLKSGRGQERAAIGTVFDGTWDRGRKSGRGTRKMVFGAIEEQVGTI